MAESLTDGILAGQEPAGEGLIHQRNQRCVLFVA